MTISPDTNVPPPPVTEDVRVTGKNPDLGKFYRKLKTITTLENVYTLHGLCLDAAKVIERLMTELGREDELVYVPPVITPRGPRKRHKNVLMEVERSVRRKETG